VTFSTKGTTDRREAAVAAALAGAVVVILGYASGLGASPPGEIAAVQQPPATSAPPATTATPFPVTLPDLPVAAVPQAGHRAHLTPAPHEHTPATPPPAEEPTPTAPPTPEPPSEPADACPSTLVDGLPVVGPGAAKTTAKLLPLIGGVPILEVLLGEQGPVDGDDPLACLVGELIGPPCCGLRAR
jgi:hypothetical protein